MSTRERSTGARVRKLTPAGMAMHTEYVANYTAKIKPLRESLEAEIEAFKTADKNYDVLVPYRDNLTAQFEAFQLHSMRFIEYLARQNTEETQGLKLSHELVLQSLEMKVQCILQDIDKILGSREGSVHTRAKDEVKSRHSGAKSFKSGRSSSSVMSMLVIQRAKAEAAKASLEFAERESELRKMRAQLEEQEYKASAESTRKKADLQTDLHFLSVKKEAVVAEAELKVYQEEVESRDSLSLASLPVADAKERTREYVNHQTPECKDELEPDHPPSKLNPGAAEFMPFNQSSHFTKFLLRKELMYGRLSNFDDKPETYLSWKTSFKALMTELEVVAEEELALLVKWLGPESKKYATSLRSANAANPARGRQKIWERLEERYGAPEMVENALKSKLAKFSKLDGTNPKKLYDLSDILSEIESTKENPKYQALLSYFDTSAGILPIVNKLTPSVQGKWASRATRYKRTENVPFPPFSVFCDFVREMSTMMNDPGLAFEREIPRPSRKPAQHQPPRSLNVNKTELVQSVEQSPVDDKPVCPLHKTDHSLNQCKAFRRKTLSERRQFLRENRLCYRCCESDSHIFTTCKAMVKCDVCGSDRHPAALHNYSPQRTQEGPKTQHGGEEAVTTKCTSLCGQNFTGRSCAKAVLVRVYPKGEPEKSVLSYALLDDQSNCTLGKPELFDLLGISQTTAQNYFLSSCAGRVPMSGRRVSDIQIESLDGSTKMELPVITECNEIPDERCEIPTPEIVQHHKHLKGVTLPPLHSDASILLLIGRDLPEAHHVYAQRTGPKSTPFAQQLNLGWVIVGDVCLGQVHPPCDVNTKKTSIFGDGRASIFEHCENNLFLDTKSVIQSDIKHHVFERSADDDKPGLSVEDKVFLDIMDQELTKTPDGHWIAPLPFRQSRPKLPENRHLALKRARYLDASLKRDKIKKQHFETFMDGILKNGHAEIAPPLKKDEEHWYLPIFGVYHPSKKDQIRAVFDSSAKCNGVSLNSVLLPGPDLTNNLVGVLLRFRREQVAITGDIQQMFYSFRVAEHHRNYLRFFWYRDNDTSKELIEYRMCVHVFGNAPSPAVATYGLRETVQDAEPCVKEFVEQNFYVDDGIASFSSTSEAIEVMRKTRETLSQKGKLRLHKIASNSEEVMSAFPSEDLAKDVKNLDLSVDRLPSQRSLGMNWDLETDSFTFRVSVEDKPFTRRGCLSIVNSLYDPLGFIAPVIIQGKLLLRDLVAETSDWDLPLSDSGQQKWNEWIESLPSLEEIRTPRTYTSASFQQAVGKTVHVYADASEKAIAAVAYLKVEAGESSEVGFIMGKSKVAPKHGHTIPRLELCAAVLAIEVGEFISDQLGIPLSDIRYHTDSKVVLGYLQNEVRRFYIYVGNRIDRIRKSSKPEQWSYVPTEDNPADDGTRHVAPDLLHESKWLRGPVSLQHVAGKIHPDQRFPLVEPDVDKEIRPCIESMKTDIAPSVGLETERFKKFSCWKKLVRAIAYLQHVADSFKCSDKGSCIGWHRCDQHIKSEASKRAEQFIIRTVQRDVFAKEVEALKAGRRIPLNSSISALSPFLDDEGIIRVGGRLQKAKLLSHEKNPILIPGKDHIATLLIRHFHSQVEHQGRHFTEGAVRSAGFWITGCKRLVSYILFKCIKCRKLRGSCESQKMADLPSDRLTPSPPFTFVGVDVFGPWEVTTRRTRGGQANSKRWGVLFTCLSTRAVHIELIEEMSSSSFINALRRFYSIRGSVKEFRSDRGTNFIGAVGDLRINAINVEDGPVKEFLYDSGILWKFNPPHASHMGGAWERLIGVTRRILDSMLLDRKGKCLTHEVLATLMAEVCAIINNRPIVPVSSDPDAPFILTPSVLLTQKTGGAERTHFDSLDVKDMYRSQWKQVQFLAETFWGRWKREYLPTIQPRRKWHHESPNVEVNDFVLLKDKQVTRNEWPNGIVTRVFPSEDGLIRKVEIRTVKDSRIAHFVRPVTELVVLMSSAD